MYRDPDVEQAIQKMNPAELRDDLRQEIFLVLAEMDEARLVSMYEQNYLKFFIVRTMLNMIKSDRSTFYNKFRKPFVEWDEKMDGHDVAEEDNTELIAKLNDRMSEIHWYAAKVFELYSQNGKNIMKLSRETRIPYRSLFKTVKAVRNLMKAELRKPTQDE